MRFILWIRKVVVSGVLLTLPLTGAASNSLPLHAAVQGGDMAELKGIIASAESLDTQDAKGWTALMFAIKVGKQHAVSMLLDAGASPNAGDRLGRTPLHLAVATPVDITRLLLKAGADVNQRNAGGVTALMLAAGSGRRDIIELLFKTDARLDFKDYQGNSVVDWSHRSKNLELIEILEEKLARVSKDTPTMIGDSFAEDVFVDVHFPDWFKSSFLDLREDLEEATSAGKQGLMVFISTRRCSYCKAFIQNSLDLPDIRQRLQGAYDVVGLEIFDDNEMIDPAGRSYRVKEFVSANKAAYTPTLIFYGAKGHKLLKIVGYYPPDKFRTVLDYLEGQHYQREPLRSYFSKTAASPSKPESGITTDDTLFSRPPHILDRRAGPAKQPLMVLFEKPNCSACRRFHNKVLRDKPIRYLMGEFEVIQLDASDTNTRLITPAGKRISPAQWFEQLDLTYSPAIVFFDEAGEEVMRLDSETQRFRMEGSLQLVLEKGYQQDAQLQRWRRKKAIQLFKLNSGN
ncbi:MAG: ankyrin repeat domain-containing protein [gamma proteobacterium endosymbiont of Lamellibrachia anaximandri]|nr:ankyrin repeat domain-containing protein [gamma proteobacterium endosymbiont of Lamellibrachia anaximandri]